MGPVTANPPLFMISSLYFKSAGPSDGTKMYKQRWDGRRLILQATFSLKLLSELPAHPAQCERT